MLWFQQGLCVLPSFLVVWSSTTFIVSYIIAICRGDVNVLFPYISDTGTHPPESCIFGLMTFISACAATATMYAMYKFVEKLNQETRVLSPHLNRAALAMGLISCLGMCVVATFQETLVPPVHDFGALLFFISGIVYLILQTFISYKVYPYGSSLCVCRIRCCIAFIAFLAFFPTLICAFFYKHPQDKENRFRLASAGCEWFITFSFICFFFTYINDFKLFTLRIKTAYEE